MPRLHALPPVKPGQQGPTRSRTSHPSTDANTVVDAASAATRASHVEGVTPAVAVDALVIDRAGGARGRAVPAWTTHLAHAALQRRSDGPEGTERMVGPAQERRVRAIFTTASAPTVTRLEGLLAAAGEGTAGAVARGLLLRAMAARADALVHGDAALALATLERFLGQLQGQSAEALRRRATVLDLDSRRTDAGSTTRPDPQSYWKTRGVVHAREHVVAAGPGQDGLFQRFTGSCGPTTLQMMLAESDPVVAFAIHDAGLTSDSTSDATATFQRVLLEQYGGGKSLGRVEGWLRARVRNAVGRLVLDGALDDTARRALDDALFGGATPSHAAHRALAVLRERYGFPSVDEVERLRARRWPRADDGITTESLVELVNEHYAPAAGARYEARVFAAGQAFRHLDDVERALRRGFDVPFGCSDPGHWMLLSAVKGRKPNRAFLVSDPDGGRTLWVTEKELRRGSFLADRLHLAKPGQRPWVDSFLLPDGRASGGGARA
jgi:hypothetical protein